MRDEMIYPPPKSPKWRIKKSELLALPDHEYDRGLHRLEAPFQMRASVHDIRDSKILKATIFNNDGEAQAIIFCDKNVERDISYLPNAGKWSEACLENLAIEGNEWYYKTHSIATRAYYPTEYEKSIATEYFEYVGIPSAEAILQFQYKLRNIKLQQQHERTQQYINSIMSQLKPPPKDLDQFAKNQILTDHRFLFYQRHGKNLEGTCSFCHKFVTLPANGKQHNDEVKCHHCRSRVTLKAAGKIKNDLWKSAYFVVANTISSGLMLRRFYVSSRIRHMDHLHAEEILTICEDARAFVPFNGTKGKHYVSENDNGEIKWKCVDGRHPTYYGWAANRDIPAFWFPLYQKGLTKELKGTPFEYAGIQQATRYMKCRIDVEEYIFRWKNRPYLETFVKGKLYALAEDVYRGEMLNSKMFLSGSDRRLYKLLGVRKSDIKIIQKYDFSHSQLDIYKLVLQESDAVEWVKLTKRSGDKDLNKLNAQVLYPKLKKCIERFGVNIARRLLFEYIPTQKRENENYINTDIEIVLSDWMNYTDECRELGYNMEDTMVLYPKNLTHSHAITTCKIKKHKKMLTDKRMRHRYKSDRKQYEYKSGDYLVMLPRNQTDLINEGKMLCHCVARYDTQVADGSTTILFIRKRENPSAPFVTAEFSGGRVVQIRGYKNRAPEQEVLQFFEEYKKKVLSKINKKAGKSA